MGLDMYLTKKNYIAARYEHRNVKATVEISINGKKVNIDPTKIGEITEDVGYWRKANAIHNWFVTNVQFGKDECEEHSVSYEQLLVLKTLCEKVIKTKNATLLPPTSGFFFGATTIDEYYFADLYDTIKIIETLDPEGDYYYQSSW